MKNTIEYLTEAEELLEFTPPQMAEAIGMPYDSYKNLKNGRRAIRDIHVRAIDLLLTVQFEGRKKASSELVTSLKDQRRALEGLRSAA